MGVRLAGEESGYLDAPLDPEGWETRQLSLVGFARNGCRLWGTVGCASCSLRELIPLEDCDSPESCRVCEVRDRCPCGSEAFGMEQRWAMVEEVLRRAYEARVEGSLLALRAVAELRRLLKCSENGTAR